MSDSTVSPIAAVASVGKAPNNLAVSNIWNHMSSTVTAIGLVIVAIGPILAQPMPTTQAQWMVAGIALVTAVFKALGR